MSMSLRCSFSDDIPSKVEDYCNKENVKLRGWLGGKKNAFSSNLFRAE